MVLDLSKYHSIFIHINKCGGTSVKGVCKKYDTILICDNYDEKSNKNTVQIKKTELWDKAFKFTLVRHPFSRVISLWNMVRRDINSNITLDRVISITLDPTIGYTKTTRTDEFIKRHTLPISHPHYGIVSNSGEIVVDFIGKLENIDEDWKFIQKRVGVKDNLLHLNKTPNPTVHTYLTSDQKAKLYQYYLNDFKLFEYQP